MRIGCVILAMLAMAGCSIDPESGPSNAELQRQINVLAEASIKNSEAIKDLAEASKKNSESISIIARAARPAQPIQPAEERDAE